MMKYTIKKFAGHTLIVSEDPEVNFIELVKLSKKIKSLFFREEDFTIEGNHKKFTIKNHYDGFSCVFMIVFFLLFCIPTVLIITNPTNIWFWTTEIILGTMIFLVFRFYKTSSQIILDTGKKIIIIRKNNIFAKPIKSPTIIPFSEFKRFFSEIKAGGIGAARHQIEWQRIYIEYRSHRKFLLDITYGPNYRFPSHRIFMDCLRRIIRYYDK
ncbi:hypothetical protein [Flagellimonas marina]|uniref:YcxB-like protein domain-containing protein n=1 Tax=Flagellimonas marina TaxID=1775168 RepID=A0ABV8PQD9_9FLAO